MALLATLEGENETITLNDLFDVNDFLGVKYFGPENWNRIKKCACIITTNATNNPVVFFLDNLKNDYPAQPSELANCLFGFNDPAGRRAMGAPAWNTLKTKLDAELLGLSIGNVVSKIGSGIKTAAGYAYDVATAPIKAGEYIMEKTPLKYTPGAKWYKTSKEYKEKYVDNPVKSTTQAVVDKTSGTMYKIATETPLKYTGAGQMIKYMEKGREAAGITSPGTAEVYESEEEIIRQKRAAAEAAAKAASAASVAESKRVAAEKKLRAQAEQTAQAQAEAVTAAQEAAVTQQALEQAQQTLTSKYAPWILGGAGLLVALSILKK